MKNETNKTTPETITIRKKRKPRQLTLLEVEAKQQFDDAKVLAKILPVIDDLSYFGYMWLREHLEDTEDAHKSATAAPIPDASTLDGTNP